MMTSYASKSHKSFLSTSIGLLHEEESNFWEHPCRIRPTVYKSPYQSPFLIWNICSLPCSSLENVFPVRNPLHGGSEVDRTPPDTPVSRKMFPAEAFSSAYAPVISFDGEMEIHWKIEIRFFSSTCLTT